jgi:hypothetical protein
MKRTEGLSWLDRVMITSIIYILSKVLHRFVGLDHPYASQVVDGCIAVREGLRNGQAY